MDFACSVTGKSPSTTGFGSEGALTKGPFNALWPVVDLNNALVSFILTGYDGFSTAAKRFAIWAPNHYLDMIGVRRSHQGRGLARILLEAVHEHAAADERSTGVSLTTEQPANVQLYEHFGYRLRGHARVDDGLETWTLFREKPAAPPKP